MMYPHVEHPQLLLPDGIIDGSNGESKSGLAALIHAGVIQGIGEVEALRKECPQDTVDVHLAGATLCPGADRRVYPSESGWRRSELR